MLDYFVPLLLGQGFFEGMRAPSSLNLAKVPIFLGLPNFFCRFSM